MAKSRKDSKGYVLKTGELQRKDGRYSFSYTDVEKNRRTVYANSLAELRKKERQIVRDIEDGINAHDPEKLTLNDLFDRYMEQKFNLKPSTRAHYLYSYNHFVRGGFGKRKITDIRFTDVKKFYYGFLDEKAMKAYTLDNVHTVIHPAFQMAVRDGLLRVNPSDGVMTEIKKSNLWDKSPRHALTVPQQKLFVDFMKDNREYQGWVPVIMVLLGTGMRIGECLGLRWDDLDFDNRMISVNHSFIHRNFDDGTDNFHISTPKTQAGTRTIPMIDEVYDAFLTEYQIQKCLRVKSVTIDGYTNFVFIGPTGNVVLPGSVNRAIRIIRDACNAAEAEAAKAEGREPVVLPEFSAHHLRHTFCTRFCENESNIKVIQSVMGHADISTTLDVYAEATNEKKQEIMANLQGKIIL